MAVCEQPAAFYRVWLPLARFFGGILFFLLGRVRVDGKENIPSSGGLLILSNHLADIDPPTIEYGCPRHIRFMAKSELFEMKFLGKVIRFFGAFPVKRGEPDRESIRTAVELLKCGEAVGVFPEGQLSESGELGELKSGVALIVRMAGCPVICCGLRGTNLMLPYGKLIPRPAWGKVSVHWGEAKQFDRSATTEEIMDWVRSQLQSLTASGGTGRR